LKFAEQKDIKCVKILNFKVCTNIAKSRTKFKMPNDEIFGTHILKINSSDMANPAPQTFKTQVLKIKMNSKY